MEKLMQRNLKIVFKVKYACFSKHKLIYTRNSRPTPQFYSSEIISASVSGQTFLAPSVQSVCVCVCVTRAQTGQVIYSLGHSVVLLS